MQTKLGTLALSFALAGCGGGGPSHHLGAAAPAVPTGAPVYRIVPNAGTLNYTYPGYAITAASGNAYRIVWTGQGPRAFDEFYGSIYTTGNFTRFAPGGVDPSCGCGLEGGDYVGSPVPTTGGMRFDFDTFASDGYDGVDFAVDTEPAYFFLWVDGAPDPTLISFSATDNNGAVSPPGQDPFGLTTQ